MNSMNRKAIIHIGLHKTATRHLQRSLFANLDNKRFLYNPPAFMAALKKRLRPESDSSSDSVLDAQYARMVDNEDRTIIISEPQLAGWMYDCHKNYKSNIEIIHRYFPECEIIFFVRDQADWLLSAYRQSMQKGSGGPIEVFLNYYDGEFRDKVAPLMRGIRNVEALKLQFLTIYKAYVEKFGEDHVHLFHYSDFRNRRPQVIKRLVDILSLEAVPIIKKEKVYNRSFSALAINLFFGNVRAPRRIPKAGKLKGPPPPKGSFKRLLNPRRAFNTFRRQFIRKIFDRIMYIDWDLLERGGMRSKIKDHYKKEDQELREISNREIWKP